MERQPVTSSSLKSIGYDPDTKTLEVEFHNGRVYPHYDVPADEHAEMVASKSIGSHYNKRIRGVFSQTPPETK